ncbi:amidohydrolase [Fusibacter tunisiensis]|uniref:Amidohydrolase YtcJ n=1 Tax=Fusibacter tunisiensis TaxID=1008308 RepID=A0ABS2MP75_9FIRM|nr:amidohydrolase [Fusibacter tunisiensis]MBM7561203.1 putative amidohydrolase YtcJ [Fusibacter tunisiensis]
MALLLTNGKIYVDRNVFTDSLLIKDDTIIAIGDAAKQEKSNSILYDLKGKTVIPGFNDCHLHLASVGEFLSACSLTQAKSIKHLIQIGKDYLKTHKMTALYGMGWNQDYFTDDHTRLPNRWDLDQISTEIPIVFARTCGHLAVGNSKALEILKVTPDTHIEGGEVLTDEAGMPNGIFTENAVKFIYTAIPPKSDADWEHNLTAGIEHALKNGITSVQSCDVLRNDIDAVFKALHQLNSKNSLKIRYHHQFNFQNMHDFDRYLKTEFNNPNYDTKKLSKGTLKLFKDGSLGARTAHLNAPYADAPETNGTQALSDEALNELCKCAAENGIQVITHAIGDGAIDSVIKAYEKTFDGGQNTLRHGIVHCQITSKSQLKKIAAHKIPVLVQPIFIDYDVQIVKQRVGPHLAATSYAFNTLTQLGTPIGFSTDAPVEDLNPFNNLYCAITRKPLTCNKGPLNPNEAMDIFDAIDAYTVGSAYIEFKEHFKGRLKPNFLADLIVLDQDLFTISKEDIPKIKVLKTMIGGQWVL